MTKGGGIAIGERRCVTSWHQGVIQSEHRRGNEAQILKIANDDLDETDLNAIEEIHDERFHLLIKGITRLRRFTRQDDFELQQTAGKTKRQSVGFVQAGYDVGKLNQGRGRKDSEEYINQGKWDSIVAKALVG